MNKSTIEMSFEERKADLIWHMFIDPADGNYLTARWAYDNGLFHQFYWDAAQSVEKYLKAALLLNEYSVKEYQGHDLVGLFDDFLKISGGRVFAETIYIPETTGKGHEAWQGKPYSLFIDYLDRFGSADNRYGSIGTFVNGPVIHILDRCCHDFRKFMRHNNFFGRDLHELNNENQYYHDKVTASLDWMISPSFLLERLYWSCYEVGQDKRLRSVFCKMNLSFFDERRPEEATFGGLHMMGSPVYNHLVGLLEQKDGAKDYMSREQQAYNRELVPQLKEWANRNVRFSKRLRHELQLK